MGQPAKPDPVKLFISALSSSAEALEEAKGRLVAKLGSVDVESAVLPWERGDYYAEEMGPSLLRRLWAFEKLIDPAELAATKLGTNALEAAVAKARRGKGVERPVNLDPGYIHLARVVLASTKDYTYRVLLRDGIYAEILLTWKAGGFAPNRWAGPEWAERPVIDFFDEARKRYTQQVVRQS